MGTERIESAVQDVVNVSIGALATVEEVVRFQLARGLIRWYWLVQKGEDDQTPRARLVREGADKLFSRLRSVGGFLPAQTGNQTSAQRS